MADDIKPLRLVSNNSGDGNEIKRLRDAVRYMDCIAGDGFSRIAAIAELALLGMETPRSALENVVAALSVIRFDAMATRDVVTIKAKEVGCDFIDAAARRRWDAYYAAMQEKARDDAD